MIRILPPSAANLVVVNPIVSAANQFSLKIAETSGATATFTAASPITITITISGATAATISSNSYFTANPAAAVITLTQADEIPPDTQTTITISVAKDRNNARVGFEAVISPNPALIATKTITTAAYIKSNTVAKQVRLHNTNTPQLSANSQPLLPSQTSDTYKFYLQPQTPTLISATPIKNQKIKLIYSNPTATTTTTYNIYYDTTPPITPNLFHHQKAQATTTFYITPKLPLQPHYFIITSEDNFNTESNPSNQLQALPKK